MLHKKTDNLGNEKILTTEEWNFETKHNTLQQQLHEEEKKYGSTQVKVVGRLIFVASITVGSGFGFYIWYTSELFFIIRFFWAGLIAILTGGAAGILVSVISSFFLKRKD